MKPIADLHSDFIKITSAKTSSDLDRFVDDLIKNDSQWTKTSLAYSVTVALLWSPHLSKNQMERLGSIPSIRHILAANSQIPMILMGGEISEEISNLLETPKNPRHAFVNGESLGYILSHISTLDPSSFTVQEMFLCVYALSCGVYFPVEKNKIRGEFLTLLESYKVKLEPWVQEQVNDRIKKTVAENYVRSALSENGVRRSDVLQVKKFLKDVAFVQYVYNKVKDLPLTQVAVALSPVLDFDIENHVDLEKLILLVSLQQGYVLETPLKKSVRKVISRLGLDKFSELIVTPVFPENEETFVKNLAHLRKIMFDFQKQP